MMNFKDFSVKDKLQILTGKPKTTQVDSVAMDKILALLPDGTWNGFRRLSGSMRRRRRLNGLPMNTLIYMQLLSNRGNYRRMQSQFYGKR